MRLLVLAVALSFGGCAQTRSFLATEQVCGTVSLQGWVVPAGASLCLTPVGDPTAKTYTLQSVADIHVPPTPTPVGMLQRR